MKDNSCWPESGPKAALDRVDSDYGTLAERTLARRCLEFEDALDLAFSVMPKPVLEDWRNEWRQAKIRYMHLDELLKKA